MSKSNDANSVKKYITAVDFTSLQAERLERDHLGRELPEYLRPLQLVRLLFPFPTVPKTAMEVSSRIADLDPSNLYLTGGKAGT